VVCARHKNNIIGAQGIVSNVMFFISVADHGKLDLILFSISPLFHGCRPEEV